MLRVVVMVSGGGTNLQAIIDRVADGTITNAEIVGVISNNANAYALERAKEHGIFPNKLVNTAKSPSVSRYSTKRLISLKSTRLQRYSSPIPLRPYQSEKIRKYNKKKI